MASKMVHLATEIIKMHPQQAASNQDKEVTWLKGPLGTALGKICRFPTEAWAPSLLFFHLKMIKTVRLKAVGRQPVKSHIW